MRTEGVRGGPNVDEMYGVRLDWALETTHLSFPASRDEGIRGISINFNAWEWW